MVVERHRSPSLAQRCAHAFTAATRERGERYHAQRRVTVRSRSDDAIVSLVAGSGPAPYRVVIGPDDGVEGDLQLSCECPHAQRGFPCKHMWAVLLAADRPALDTFGPHGDGFLAGDYPLDLVIDAAAGELLYAADDVPFDEVDHWHAPPPTEPQWHTALRAVDARVDEPPAAATALPGSRRSRVEYHLSLPGHHTDGLDVSWVRRTIRKTGALGAVKPLDTAPWIVRDLPEADRALIEMLVGARPHHGYGPYGGGAWRCARIPPALIDTSLPRLCATGRFGWVPDGAARSREALRPLRWDGDAPFELSVTIAPENEEHVRVRWAARRDGERIEPAALLAAGAGVAIVEDRIVTLAGGARATRWIDSLDQLAQTAIPSHDAGALIAALVARDAAPALELAPELGWSTETAAPIPHIRFRRPDGDGRRGAVRADVSFGYGPCLVRAADTGSAVCDAGSRTLYARDRAGERAAFEQLAALGHTAPPASARDQCDAQVPYRELGRVVRALVEMGWRVEADGRTVRRAGAFHMNVASGIDWFDLEVSAEFDGVAVELPALLRALKRGEGTVLLGDGSEGVIPEDWLRRFGVLAAVGDTEGAAIRFGRAQAGLLDALLDALPDVDVDAAFARIRDELRTFERVRPRNAPRGFRGSLRSYQRDGLGWLAFLQTFGFGGCLADDMGLGKTVQVLALLESRRTARGRRGPSLVVVPRSLLFNWRDEARRFAPKLRVLDYTGPGRRALRDQLAGADLVLTTYGTLRRDAAVLSGLELDYAILDEAQAIKNPRSQAAKACRLLRAAHRLALTGTPVENRLTDVGSIFEFLNPGMLGDVAALGALADDSADGERLALLSRALRPFLLRRTKEQVLPDLPPKTETTLHCRLRGKQREQYEEIRDHYRASVAQRVARDGIARSKLHVLEALLRLRQAACHPGLLDEARAGEDSAKLDVLLERLTEIQGTGHKALVFSQFTSLLRIVRARLDALGIGYEYLDGKTRDRKRRVQRFQTDPTRSVFLLSLKAGGTGLNLTAGEYVFLLDPWWNPATEAQAIDRAHRVGQTNQVFAYRLIAEDTVEEKIAELQASKRALADGILRGDNSVIGSLTAEDLELLLG